jgi:hypothetical protein
MASGINRGVGEGRWEASVGRERLEREQESEHGGRAVDRLAAYGGSEGGEVCVTTPHLKSRNILRQAQVWQ